MIKCVLIITLFFLIVVTDGQWFDPFGPGAHGAYGNVLKNTIQLLLATVYLFLGPDFTRIDTTCNVKTSSVFSNRLCLLFSQVPFHRLNISLVFTQSLRHLHFRPIMV